MSKVAGGWRSISRMQGIYSSVALCSLLLFGACAPTARSAQPLVPGAAEDSEAIWVYIDTDDASRGVYRCRETRGEPPVCVRARLRE